MRSSLLDPHTVEVCAKKAEQFGHDDYRAVDMAAGIRALLTAPEQSVEVDREDREDVQFNRGVDHVVAMLARVIGAENWVAGDGSEDYDSDLGQTLMNILAAGELYDPDTGRYATLPQPQASDGVRAVLERCRTILGNMAKENETLRDQFSYGSRWPISHEPLRADAKNLLPEIDRALAASPTPPKMGNET